MLREYTMNAAICYILCTISTNNVNQHSLSTSASLEYPNIPHAKQAECSDFWQKLTSVKVTSFPYPVTIPIYCHVTNPCNHKSVTDGHVCVMYGHKDSCEKPRKRHTQLAWMA